MRRGLVGAVATLTAVASACGGTDAATTPTEPVSVAPVSTAQPSPTDVDATAPIATSSVPALEAPTSSGDGLPQPLMTEAFEQIDCATVTASLGLGPAEPRLAGIRAFVDDGGVCAVNLVPGVTYAEGSLPDPAGTVWVLLLRGPGAGSALPAQTITEFVAAGGAALSIGSSNEPFLEDFPRTGDEAAGFVGFELGDGRGVMARQSESIVTATWNGAESGDRSLRFVAGGATEAAVVAIISEVAGRTPTFPVATP